MGFNQSLGGFNGPLFCLVFMVFLFLIPTGLDKKEGPCRTYEKLLLLPWSSKQDLARTKMVGAISSEGASYMTWLRPNCEGDHLDDSSGPMFQALRAKPLGPCRVEAVADGASPMRAGGTIGCCFLHQVLCEP